VRRFLAAAALLLALGPAGSRPAAAAVIVPVDIVVAGTNAWAYRPGPAIIRVGDTVQWTNRDRDDAHNVEIAAESYSGPYLALNESDYFQFTRPGRFVITCEPHPSMSSLVIVTDRPVFLPFTTRRATS
jgi:plastocyanin